MLQGEKDVLIARACAAAAADMHKPCMQNQVSFSETVKCSIAVLLVTSKSTDKQSLQTT